MPFTNSKALGKLRIVTACGIGGAPLTDVSNPRSTPSHSPDTNLHTSPSVPRPCPAARRASTLTPQWPALGQTASAFAREGSPRSDQADGPYAESAEFRLERRNAVPARHGDEGRVSADQPERQHRRVR